MATILNLFKDTDVIISALVFGAFIGLLQIITKKPIAQIFGAIVKTVIGFYIFNIGVSVFLRVANNMRLLAIAAFDVIALPNTNNYFQTSAIYYVPVMGFGFLIHLLIERFIIPKKHKFLYMGGGHVLLRVSLLTTGIAVVVYGQTNWFAVVLFGTIITGLWYCFQPAYIHGFIKKLRGDDTSAYGHQTSIAVAATGLLTKLFVRKRYDGDDTESVVFPKWFAFLRDMGVCMFILQTVVMLIFGLLCGQDAVRVASDSDMNALLWILTQGVLFSGGYFILTNGLRMITTEMVPSLSAIGEKILPGARMAIDVPALFPQGQNAVLFGALSGSTVFIALLFIFAKLGWGFIGGATLYFYMVAGGTAVFGNKVGGKRGAIIAGIVTGLMMAFGNLLIQRLGGAFYEMEYFCNVASEPDDRLILYPLVIALGRLLFGKRDIPMGL